MQFIHFEVKELSEEMKQQFRTLTEKNLLAGEESVGLDVEFSIDPDTITDEIAQKLMDPDFDVQLRKELVKNAAVLDKMLQYGGYGEVDIILCGTTEDDVETIEDDLIKHLAAVTGLPEDSITLVLEQDDDHVTFLSDTILYNFFSEPYSYT